LNTLLSLVQAVAVLEVLLGLTAVAVVLVVIELTLVLLAVGQGLKQYSVLVEDCLTLSP
jgi:hypothetical protein